MVLTVCCLNAVGVTKGATNIIAILENMTLNNKTGPRFLKCSQSAQSLHNKSSIANNYKS